MSDKKFVEFIEYNEWEGKTWRFWLPLEGNEEALNAFANEVLDCGEECYRINLDKHVDEAAVDVLVEYADDTGYLASHTKIEGVLTLPETLGDHADVLYKGGIRDLFTVITP